MRRREFKFTIEEVDTVYDNKMSDRRRDILVYTSGIVFVDKNGEVEVHVDDTRQPYPHSSFQSKDRFFNKIIRKIHEATKWR